MVDDRPRRARRAILSRAADLIIERQNEIAETMIEETGATFGWGMFNCMLASGMLREAAAQTYGAVGEVIPSDIPGKLAMAVRAPVGVVVGISSVEQPPSSCPSAPPSRRRWRSATPWC